MRASDGVITIADDRVVRLQPRRFSRCPSETGLAGVLRFQHGRGSPRPATVRKVSKLDHKAPRQGSSTNGITANPALG